MLIRDNLDKATAYDILCPQSVANVHALPRLPSFIYSSYAFRSVDQVRCSRHSMAALQPALSWSLGQGNRRIIVQS